MSAQIRVIKVLYFFSCDSQLKMYALQLKTASENIMS